MDILHRKLIPVSLQFVLSVNLEMNFDCIGEVRGGWTAPREV